jgi:hypothetical protein
MTKPTAVQTLNEIIAGRTGDEAGSVALSRLLAASWFANLGKQSDRDHEVERVTTWPDALRIFPADPDAVDGRTLLALDPAIGSHYASSKGVNTNGTLNAPFWLLLQRLDLSDELNRKTATAAKHALDAFSWPAVKPALDRHHLWPGDSYARRFAEEDSFLDTSIAMSDYVIEFVRLLFIEIYAGDIAAPQCTYFRDQLGWFLAGFFPCGWEGEWPHGRMRVF